MEEGDREGPRNNPEGKQHLGSMCCRGFFQQLVHLSARGEGEKGGKRLIHHSTRSPSRCQICPHAASQDTDSQ